MKCTMKSLQNGGMQVLSALNRFTYSTALLAFLLGIFNVNVFGQTPRSLTLAVGARGGAGFSKVSFLPYQDTRGGISYEAGLSLRLTRHDYVAMLVELNYLHTAYRTKEYTLRNYMIADADRWQGTQEIGGANDWIALPCLLQLYYHFPHLTLQAVGGGVVDYMLTDYVALEQKLEKQPMFQGVAHQRPGIGILGGAAIGVRSRVGTFLVEYRFYYRFTNLYHRERIPKAAEPASRLMNHFVGIAYYFTLGGNAQGGEDNSGEGN